MFRIATKSCLHACGDWCSNGVLRKLIAITLLVLFGLPFASSLFALAPKSEANLPACCRQSGKHHCMMSMAQRNRAQREEPGFMAPLERCPYCPATVLGAHHAVDFRPSPGQVIYAGLVSHPTGVAQTECKLRIARDRACGKRGPPAFSNL
jgi:hypothetical protein